MVEVTITPILIAEAAVVLVDGVIGNLAAGRILNADSAAIGGIGGIVRTCTGRGQGSPRGVGGSIPAIVVDCAV